MSVPQRLVLALEPEVGWDGEQERHHGTSGNGAGWYVILLVTMGTGQMVYVLIKFQKNGL